MNENGIEVSCLPVKNQLSCVKTRRQERPQRPSMPEPYSCRAGVVALSLGLKVKEDTNSQEAGQ